MPNQEIMREWVRNLRSGEYEQGRGALNVDGNFCCLGVLCQMAADQGVIAQPTLTRELVSTLPYVQYGTHTVARYEHGATTMPPQKVYEWAGIHSLPEDFKDIESDLYGRRLADMNDSGKTFAQIADIIEEHWIDLPEGTEIPDSPAAIEVTEKEDVNA